MNDRSAPLATALAVAVAAGLALALPAARAQATEAPLQALVEGPPGPLKQVYLACDEASLQRALGSDEAALCSTVYEALKRRFFDGDFERVLAWSRQAHAERLAARADTDSATAGPRAQSEAPPAPR